jgi:hypothetical protein
MKTVLLTLSIVLASSAFADKLDCYSEQTGQTYYADTDYSEAGRLVVISASNEPLYSIWPLQVSSSTTDLYPVETTTQFIWPDRGDVLFEVIESEGKLTATFGEDKNIKCTYK